MTSRMEQLKRLFRSEALEFPKYTLKETAHAIRLHQNETLGLSAAERASFVEVLASSILSSNETVNTYPSLQPCALVAAFAKALAVPTENLEVTSGSSQALTLIAEAFFAPGRSIAITSPSFSLYFHLAKLYGGSVCEISLDENFNFTRAELFKKQILESHLALICSPNNPTGTCVDPELLLEFADTYQGMLVLDEAYVEFYEVRGGQSFLQEAIKRDNVIVLRTMSKAWAAAGLRIGAVVANADIVDVFRALKPPYSIPRLSEILATHVLENQQRENRERLEVTVQLRADLQRALCECSGIEKIVDSHANFVFFLSSRAEQLERSLLAQGFLLRRYSSGRLQDAVRISMPAPENFPLLKKTLLEVLR
ncbi:histidinol-phosphate aminotransferase family protein [bacterium]|nr:histidinol-phosphate aminotransferase family protein [bacterium]